jgi:hypothetical protein
MLKKSTTRVSKYFSRQADYKWYLRLFIGVLTIFVIALTAAHMTRPYNSDDVCIQNILDSFIEGNPREGVVGTDNFIIRLPLYLLANVVPNSRAQLFFMVIICNLILFIPLAYVAYTYLFKRQVYKRWHTILIISPLMWYLGLTTVPLDSTDKTFSAFFSGMYLNLNYRNAEIGIMLLIALAFKQFILDPSTSRRKSYAWSIALAVILSLFFYNDPFFLYIFGGALIVASGILYVHKKVALGRLVTVLAIISLAFLGSIVINKICAAYGFIAADNIEKAFISTDSLMVATQNMIHGLFQVFRADFWGQRLAMKATILFLLNSSLVFISILSLYSTARSVFRKPKFLVSAMFFVIVISFVIYLLTTSGSLTSSFRYLFVAAVVSTLLTASYIASGLKGVQVQKKRLAVIIGVLCVVGSLVNSSINLVAAATAKPGDAQKDTRMIIDELKSRHLTKGYSTYWASNTLSYLSNRETVVLPLICGSPKMSPPVRFEWLVNISDFNIKSADGRTFFLYDTLAGEPQCDAMNRVPSASEVVHISDRYTLYIYDSDIGKTLGSYRPDANN